MRIPRNLPPEFKDLFVDGKIPQAVKTFKLLKPRDLQASKLDMQGGFAPEWLEHVKKPELRAARLSHRFRKLLETKTPPANLLSSFQVHEVRSVYYPWSTIGKVMVGLGDGLNIERQLVAEGSGVLVAKNAVLTAGHILKFAKDASNQGQPWWMRFMPAFDGVERLPGSFVEKFYSLSPGFEPAGYDLAICKLYTPIGLSCGWMGRYAWPNNHQQYKRHRFSSAGYPKRVNNGRTQAVKFDIKIVDVDSDSFNSLELETHPFATYGWSGGPLFKYFRNNPYPAVVGICSGEEWDWGNGIFREFLHVFAGGQFLLDLVAYAERRWS